MVWAISIANVLFGSRGLVRVCAMTFVMTATKRAPFTQSSRLLFRRDLGYWRLRRRERRFIQGRLYLSVVNCSSLGLDDIYPTGHLRFLASVEALNGFLLIRYSASTSFSWSHENSI